MQGYNNFPPNAKGKICYFIRKGPLALTPENMRESLIFGDVSGLPVDDVSVILDDIFYPMLSNPCNQVGWPEVIMKDVDSHVQELRNVLAEV